MAEADDELDIRRELDTRDSLASMAHYHASSPSAITAQVLPPSFIPTATGRVRPVTGAFPAIQSDEQEKQSQLGRSVRSVRSLAAGSLRKTQDPMQTVMTMTTAITVLRPAWHPVPRTTSTNVIRLRILLNNRNKWTCGQFKIVIEQTGNSRISAPPITHLSYRVKIRTSISGTQHNLLTFDLGNQYLLCHRCCYCHWPFRQFRHRHWWPWIRRPSAGPA